MTPLLKILKMISYFTLNYNWFYTFNLLIYSTDVHAHIEMTFVATLFIIKKHGKQTMSIIQ